MKKRALNEHQDADDIVWIEQDVAYLKKVLVDLHGCMDSPSEINVHYHPTNKEYHIYAFGYCRPVRLADLQLIAVGIESTRSFSCQKGHSIYIEMLQQASHNANRQGALVLQLRCADGEAHAAESRGRKRVSLAEDNDGEERPRSRSLARTIFSAMTGL